MREVKTHVSFFVPGLPVSKGSTKAYVTKQGKTIIRQSNADRQKPWASLISVMAQNICEIADCAISLELAFVFPRPKSHFHSVKMSYILQKLGEYDTDWVTVSITKNLNEESIRIIESIDNVGEIIRVIHDGKIVYQTDLVSDLTTLQRNHMSHK